MDWKLQQIDRFNSDAEFGEVKSNMDALVRAGDLEICGLDPSATTELIEVYKTKTGEEWYFAHPDQAFRGYLRKASSR